MQIDLTFANWKALTNRLIDEEDSYDRVIERLLALQTDDGGTDDPSSQSREVSSGSGAVFKGVFLPDGTELRATYRGETHHARIINGQWIDPKNGGERRTSPSEAAYQITGSGVNGWLFWLVKRPTDASWRSLNELRGK